MKRAAALFLMLLASTIAQVTQIAVHVGTAIITFNHLPKSTVTFAFSGGAVDSSGNMTLAISQSTSRMPSVAGQFDILYPTTVTNLGVTAGPVLAAANKTLTCNLVSAGDTRCIYVGLNSSAIGNGVVANITATITASSTLTLSAVVASNASGSALNSAISQPTANVSLPAALASVVCVIPTYDAGAGLPPGTYNIESAESTTCTAMLSAPAPAGGFTAMITAQAGGLTLPASLVVPAGQISAQFTVTGQ